MAGAATSKIRQLHMGFGSRMGLFSLLQMPARRPEAGSDQVMEAALETVLSPQGLG